MSPAGQLVRAAVWVAIGLLLAVALLWPADWLVWRVRVASGGGMGLVTVSRFTVATLKGDKEEYYFEGSETVACSESLFQHAGEGACRSLRKHPQVVQRY